MKLEPNLSNPWRWARVVIGLALGVASLWAGLTQVTGVVLLALGLMSFASGATGL